ncbi:cytochrome P450 [Streptomyces sp. B1866]|uniref:cytochrome P450 n=1 Tax=Streptomyces sp. B1866 TaxID=3075431 RepID=UPI00289165D6|nr:cytochrome P450 [Streptomyces sp. B1866]MDT3395891.1 cytochrome P450 [Streptomyces sp. B1866]
MTTALVPPGPRGHPVLGSIREIQRDNVSAFMDAFRHHGDIVNFRGPLRIQLLAHPDYVQHVLRDQHKHYPRPRKVQGCLSTIVGDGLVAAEGASWLRSRRLTQPAFHRDALRRFGETFTATTAELLDGWQRRGRDAGPVDVKSEMMHLSLANLARALFKTDLTEAITRIEPAVQRALAFTHRRMTSPVDPLRVPSQGRRRFLDALGTVNSVLHPMITERRRTGGSDDLVGMLLGATDPETGEAFTDAQIRDEVSGFFVAGHETVSTALTWTWYLLSLNPESARRLRAEVDEVLAGRVPTVEDLPKLTYTTMVVQEAMRLFPPIFVYMRCAAQDDTIGGYHVPAGRWVVVCPYVTHRHPEFWDNPEGFEPERFTPARSADRHRMAYLPFGAGPRKCIGDSFAMLQMPLVIAMIAQRFRLDLVEGQHVVPEPAISLRPRDPMWMWLRPVEETS